MTLRRFAKSLGYLRSSDREFKGVLKLLLSRKLLEIQQSGFKGDSLHHPKLVVILQPFEIDQFKRVVLRRTNFKIGDFTVHRTTKERKCESCRKIIRYGQRYGVNLKFGRQGGRGRPRRVYAGTTLCLPCLIEKAVAEGWDV